ncbi:MAG: hypothetical protein KUG77_03395 [Nannocystaceae bacterium]|nr:hypothetical protein [Nannocystaceae bacterium]
MKLRILGDSLRLRLSQSEVKQFGDTARVEQSIRFGPGSVMTYAIEHSDAVNKLYASFADSTLTVRMPSSIAQAWVRTDEVSLRGEQPLDGDEPLSLLIEKDFKCAIPRPGEEDYDGFEHPTGGC